MRQRYMRANGRKYCQQTYSIRINDQWRLCFEWRDGDAYEVAITDYH